MESYVVRIYRRSRKPSRVLVGTVEPVGAEGKLAFSNAEELWQILEHRTGGGPPIPPDTPAGAGNGVTDAPTLPSHAKSADGGGET